MDHSNVVTSNTDTSYKIPGIFNCQSKNIIYVLTCETHNIQYVGETQQTLNARFRLHESMINTEKENLVADHFNDENYLNNKLDYKINIVVQEAIKNRRLRLEEAWMLLLNTHYPNGLNSKWWHQQKELIRSIFTWSLPQTIDLEEINHQRKNKTAYEKANIYTSNKSTNC